MLNDREIQGLAELLNGARLSIAEREWAQAVLNRELAEAQERRVEAVEGGATQDQEDRKE